MSEYELQGYYTLLRGFGNIKNQESKACVVEMSLEKSQMEFKFVFVFCFNVLLLMQIKSHCSY